MGKNRDPFFCISAMRIRAKATVFLRAPADQPSEDATQTEKSEGKHDRPG